MEREKDHEIERLIIPLPRKGLAEKAVVLATKLYVPRPNRDFVSRPRLSTLLEGVVENPLTLVYAPAGYGKTTLLADWANGCQCPVAWLSLDPGDNDPAHFWTYFVSALQTLWSDVGRCALTVLQATGATSSETFLNTLLNEIGQVEGDWTLILDDYHVIASEAVHGALAYLIDHLPEQMHLVLATRTVPPLPLARLFARNQLVEIGKDALRFTCAEVVEFLGHLRVVGLSPQDLAVLQAKTEGWAAGLQLVALSIAAQPDASQYIAHLTGSQRRISDFLMAEVLQQQPLHVQEFLLKTSILDQLCASLCDALLGDGYHGSHEIIHHLEHTNLFVTALDDERRWYRYHHLFASFLRDRLDKLHADLVPDLYRCASLWYEQAGLNNFAVRAALAGQDFERAAHLIEVSYQTMVRRTETTTLLNWIEALPGKFVRSRPRLGIAKAWSLVVTRGRLQDAEACLAETAKVVHSSETHFEDEKERGNVMGELAHLRSVAAIIENEPDRVIEFSKEALRFLPKDNEFLQRATHIDFGIACVLSGDLPAARHQLAEAIKSQDVIPNVMSNCWVRYYLAEVELLEGHLHKSAELFRMSADAAALPGGRYMPVAMAPHIALAGLYYEWNDLEAALHHLNLGIELSHDWWRRDILIQAYVTRARTCEAQGDREGARLAVAHAEDAFEDKYLPQLVAHAAVSQVQAWMQAGYLHAAVRRMESLVRARKPSPEINPAKQDEALALARLLVAEGQLKAALQWLEPLAYSAERGKFNRRLIEILVLQSLAFWGMGNKRQSTFSLTRALTSAETEGHVRIFVDEGAPIRVMLEQIEPCGAPLAYTAKLLAALGEPAPYSPLRAGSLVEPLSERELEVLRLIAAGQSLHEVAIGLVISVGTVRNHLKNIYGKLQAHTRLQAVQRARDLNLL